MIDCEKDYPDMMRLILLARIELLEELIIQFDEHGFKAPSLVCQSLFKTWKERLDELPESSPQG